MNETPKELDTAVDIILAYRPPRFGTEEPEPKVTPRRIRENREGVGKKDRQMSQAVR